MAYLTLVRLLGSLSKKQTETLKIIQNTSEGSTLRGGCGGALHRNNVEITEIGVKCCVMSYEF